MGSLGGLCRRWTGNRRFGVGSRRWAVGHGDSCVLRRSIRGTQSLRLSLRRCPSLPLNQPFLSDPHPGNHRPVLGKHLKQEWRKSLRIRFRQRRGTPHGSPTPCSFRVAVDGQPRTHRIEPTGFTATRSPLNARTKAIIGPHTGERLRARCAGERRNGLSIGKRQMRCSP
jgi:hypothetical protein